MPVEVDVPEHLVKCAHQQEGDEFSKAVADLILIAFYFLLRVGEYTVKGSRNETKRTVQFRVKDVTLFQKDEGGRLKQVSRRVDPKSLVGAVDAATMKLDNQKNGWKGVCISHHSNGMGLFDPTEAILRRLSHIREHTSDEETFLSAVWVDGKWRDVRDQDIRAALNAAAAVLDYPHERGIPIELVDTHSLRIGGANAMSLAGYSDREIQKLGRWRSITFMEYIRESLSTFSEGISSKMKKCFGFTSLEGGAFRDVTENVLATEYNVNVSEGAAVA
eukprot:scaffold42146_cov69-Cyclotella_meneghiniana.AAC.1